MKKTSIIGIMLLVSVLAFMGCSDEESEIDEVEIVTQTSLEEVSELEDKYKNNDNQLIDKERPGMEIQKDTGMPVDELSRGGMQTGELSNQEMVDMDEIMQEMIDVCSTSSQGDTCSIETPMGSEEGTCILVNDDLICQIERQDRPMRN